MPNVDNPVKDTLQRQWSLLRLIPHAPAKRDASRLQRELEDEGFPTTLRTVQRDLILLEELFPIESDKTNKPYGWRWRKNTLLNIPGMDSSTALTFSLAKQMIQAQLPKSVLFKMQPYFQQAEQVLQELKGRKHSKWKKKIRILPQQLSLESPTIRPEISDALYDALLQETPIQIQYQKRNDPATTQYWLHPVGLVFQDIYQPRRREVAPATGPLQTNSGGRDDECLSKRGTTIL